jgi:hypothetical protein
MSLTLVIIFVLVFHMHFKMKQQQQPSRPVLIEPDSDVDEPPRKRFKSGTSRPLSTPKTNLLEALKVLQNTPSCPSPDETTSLPIEINRKIGTISYHRLDTSIIHPTRIPSANDVVIKALSPVSAPPKIPNLLLPPGRPLGLPPRLPRMIPGESIKRFKVVQR